MHLLSYPCIYQCDHEMKCTGFFQFFIMKITHGEQKVILRIKILKNPWVWVIVQVWLWLYQLRLTHTHSLYFTLLLSYNGSFSLQKYIKKLFHLIVQNSLCKQVGDRLLCCIIIVKFSQGGRSQILPAYHIENARKVTIYTKLVQTLPYLAQILLILNL